MRILLKDGGVLEEPVSASRLSQVSEFFQALFRNDKPVSAAFEKEPTYQISVLVKDVMFMKQLFRHLHGDPLILTESTVASALLLGDMWGLDSVLLSVADFLYEYTFRANFTQKATHTKTSINNTLRRIVQVNKHANCLCVHVSVQVYSLLSVASSYGVQIECVTKLMEVQDQCINWIASHFTSVLLHCEKLQNLPKDLLSRAVEKCKQVKPSKILSVLKRYNRCIVSIDHDSCLLE